MRVTPLLAAAAVVATAAAADPVRIEGIQTMQRSDGWVISVTIRHTDTGWEDFANGWRVELPDGTILAAHELKHPHVTEQPFTRSQTGVAIPPGTPRVVVRPRGTVDGWAEHGVMVDLAQ